MKNMKWLMIACAFVLMFVGTQSVFAATTTTATDMTGTWTGQMHAKDGTTYQLTFVFKQHGSKLSGIALGPTGEPLPIESGKVSGSNFSFDVANDETVVNDEGTLDGDVITLNTKSSQSHSAAKPITLTRSK